MNHYLLSSKELYHHGIKGQKWGVRRFQNKDGTRTAAGKDRAKYSRERKLSDDQKSKRNNWKTGSEYVFGSDRTTHEMEVFSMTDGSRQAFSTAKVLGDFMKDTGAPPDFMQYRDVRGNVIPPKYVDADLKSINPGFGEPGTTQNCTKCAVAVQLAEQYGIKVSAGRCTFPASADAFSYWFDGATKTRASADEMQKTLASYGDGASGTLAGYYPNDGGGHCLHYKVQYGQVYVKDGQNATRYASIKDACDAYGFDTSKPMESYRLDTATPNWDHMAEDSVISAPPGQDKVWTVDHQPGKLYWKY